MAMQRVVEDEDITGIEWTHLTWNPWQGCDHVSAGCDLCYMYTEKHRYGQDPTRVVCSTPETFNKPLKWAKKYPEGRMVFTCSWSDFFHKDADPYRDRAWKIIRDTPNNIYQILTKRAGLMEKRLPADWGDGYPNVALGISAEDQEWAERRIPLLLQIPARWHIVSYEPALGPIDFTALRDGSWYDREGADYYDALAGRAYWREGDLGLGGGPKLDWAIFGGESGVRKRAPADHQWTGAQASTPRARDGFVRPTNLAWARKLRDDAQRNNVALFIKQTGADPEDGEGLVRIKSRKGDDLLDLPEDLRIQCWPPGMNPLSRAA